MADDTRQADTLPAAVEAALKGVADAWAGIRSADQRPCPVWPHPLTTRMVQAHAALRAAIAAALAAKDEERRSAVFRVESFQRERAARLAAEARVRELEADALLLTRLEELDLVVRPVVGGGAVWEDEDGNYDGRTYPGYREAAWAAVKHVTGETPDAARQAGEVDRD